MVAEVAALRYTFFAAASRSAELGALVVFGAEVVFVADELEEVDECEELVEFDEAEELEADPHAASERAKAGTTIKNLLFMKVRITLRKPRASLLM
ncbi:MAG: hypothetical protein ACP5O0_01885 [Acidimicrobiales bacterium]